VVGRDLRVGSGMLLAWWQVLWARGVSLQSLRLTCGARRPAGEAVPAGSTLYEVLSHLRGTALAEIHISHECAGFEPVRAAEWWAYGMQQSGAQACARSGGVTGFVRGDAGLCCAAARKVRVTEKLRAETGQGPTADQVAGSN
jgi:hypothetical protein